MGEGRLERPSIPARVGGPNEVLGRMLLRPWDGNAGYIGPRYPIKAELLMPTLRSLPRKGIGPVLPATARARNREVGSDKPAGPGIVSSDPRRSALACTSDPARHQLGYILCLTPPRLKILYVTRGPTFFTNLCDNPRQYGERSPTRDPDFNWG